VSGSHTSARALAGLAALALAAALPAPARAEEPHRPITAGAEADLVPIGVTLATKDSGFAGALWVGRWKDRLRVTAGVVHEPEKIPTVSVPQGAGTYLAQGFRRYEATRVGLHYERFLWTEFRGPWAGAGLELGWVSLGSDSGKAHTEQLNPGAAVALGWTFPVWSGLYVTPSASAHAAVARVAVLEGERRREHPVWGVLSLSVGWSERTP
jgi:hypothetical protein